MTTFGARPVLRTAGVCRLGVAALSLSRGRSPVVRVKHVVQSRHFQDIVENDKHQDLKVAELRAKAKSPLNRLNTLLRRGAFDFSLLFGKDDTILAEREGDPFGFSRLSDGERNAVFMALDVLSLPEGAIIIIDEPERHLHRSIIVPLLQAMFDERPLCFFIVATHEIALPTEARGATLIMRQCVWKGDEVKGWDADILKPDASLPEDLRVAILGSRKQILFVDPARSNPAFRPCRIQRNCFKHLRAVFLHEHINPTSRFGFPENRSH